MNKDMSLGFRRIFSSVYLPEYIYGGIDGAITTFAIIAGSVGADLSSRIIIILGLANLIADGFSMSVGSYLSSRSVNERNEKSSDFQDLSVALPINKALATFGSFLFFGSVPLLIYLVDYIKPLAFNLFMASSGMTLVAFLYIGILKTKIQQAPVWKGILETLALGIIAAFIAYLIGDFLEALISTR